MHDPVVHHAANLAAVIAPVTSVMLSLPAVLTVVLTLMGICWYGVLFYDRFFKRKNNDGDGSK